MGKEHLLKWPPGVSGNPGGRPKGASRLANKAVIQLADSLGGDTLNTQNGPGYVPGTGAAKRMREIADSDPKWEKNVFWPKLFLPVMLKYIDVEENAEHLGYDSWLRQIVAGFTIDPGLFRDVLRETLKVDALRETATAEVTALMNVIEQPQDGAMCHVESEAEKQVEHELHQVITDIGPGNEIAAAVEAEHNAALRRAARGEKT